MEKEGTRILGITVVGIVGIVALAGLVILIQLAPQNVEGFCGLSRDECLYLFAKGVGKSELCVGIRQDNLRDSCLMNTALSTEDFGACHLVGNDFLKNACYSLKRMRDWQHDETVMRTSGICAALRLDYYKDLCVESVSSRLGLVGKCSGARHAKDACFYQLAQSSLNPQICNAVLDSRIHDACVMDIVIKT